MTFDPMASAVDWLDAYRASDIDAIMSMYASDALVECGCGGTTTIAGTEALRAYWQKRLRDYPASDLDNLNPVKDGVTISYVSNEGIVSADLRFNADGKIATLRCGPSSSFVGEDEVSSLGRSHPHIG